MNEGVPQEVLDRRAACEHEFVPEATFGEVFMKRCAKCDYRERLTCEQWLQAVEDRWGYDSGT